MVVDHITVLLRDIRQWEYNTELQVFLQLVVEKMLTAQGIKRTELGREAFVDKVWEWKEKYGGTITNQMRRLGASCDWSREHFTFDDQLSGANIIVRHLIETSSSLSLC
jgi:valyl-tRNA synthetase